MRIVSLVPHATELLFALGAGPEVIAVTHECDHPTEVSGLPRVTRDALPAGLGAREIDQAVRARTLAGESIYELDQAALRTLQPDLIVTQALCSVCAVSHEEVAAIARTIPSDPRVVSLDPHTLQETLADVVTIAAAIGRPERGAELVAEARARIERVQRALQGAEPPRVAALEWLDPVFVGGHWVPEMIALAGGHDPLGTAGRPSATVSWAQVAQARPQIVLVMPCGYDGPRAHQEALAQAQALEGIGAQRVVAVDACAYFSRPGPRLIDGLELLAGIIHPDLIVPAAGEIFQVSGLAPAGA